MENTVTQEIEQNAVNIFATIAAVVVTGVESLFLNMALAGDKGTA